jgi:hypothetical protein
MRSPVQLADKGLAGAAADNWPAGQQEVMLGGPQSQLPVGDQLAVAAGAQTWKTPGHGEEETALWSPVIPGMIRAASKEGGQAAMLTFRDKGGSVGRWGLVGG